MALVTNPQVVRFCNERCRTLADEAVRLKWAIDAFKADYAAEGIGSLVGGNAGTDVIADGADVDGRTILTVTNLLMMVNAVDAVQAGIESTAVAGSGGSFAFEFLNKVQVNGSPR